VLLRLGERANLIAADAQLNAVGQLLQLVGANLNNFAAEAEEAANINLYRLNLAIWPAFDIHDMAQALAIRALDGGAPQPAQALYNLLNGFDCGLACARERRPLLNQALSDPLCAAALGFDVGPARIGGPLDTVKSVLQPARNTIEPELTSWA
jgi:hypothetical protein